MFQLRKEIDKLLEKYPDPRRGTLGLAEFHTKQENKKCYPRFGVVVDNKDPQCLGRLRIQYKGDSTVTAMPVAQRNATVSGGKAEVTWTYQYKHDSDNPLTEKPSFFFAAKAQRVAPIKSADLEVSAEIHQLILLSNEKPAAERDYYIHQVSGEIIKGTTDKEGNIDRCDLIPGTFHIEIKENT